MPSQTSLDSPPGDRPFEREDEARLTGPSTHDDRSFGAQQNRFSARMSRGASMRKTPQRGYRNEINNNRASAAGSAALKAVSRNLRRMSLRVVNLAGSNLEDRLVRLPDDPPGEDGEEDEGSAAEETLREDLDQNSLLRGRSLFIFGPRHPVRRAAYHLLLWRSV